MRIRKSPPLIPNQQKWLQGQLESHAPPITAKVIASAAKRSARSVSYVLTGETGFSDFWLRIFSELLNRGELEFLNALKAAVEDPPPMTTRPLPSRCAQRWASDESLFSDCYAGMSFMERNGTYEEMDDCIQRSLQRLKERPNDILLRAVVSWAILRRGTPEKILAIAKETAAYLIAGRPASGDHDVELDLKNWDQTIAKIRHGKIEEPGFVRRHLEDALMRACLLHWLKTVGNRSGLAAQIGRSAMSQGMPFVVESMFDAASRRGGEDWVPAAIKDVDTWLDGHHTRGLGYLFLAWLTGRNGILKDIPDTIDRICRWIKRPHGMDDSLIHWGTIWLAGMGDCRVDIVFRQARKWLRTAAAEDDRLVRMSLHWLVGARVGPEQVACVIRDCEKWLKNPLFRDDACIRASRLVWLVRRGHEGRIVTAKQRQMIIAETCRWLDEHDDQFVRLALSLAEAVP